MRLRRTAPASAQRRGWLAEPPVAHRGLHDASRPENSLAAFEQACALGYAIELDVLLTADGIPVVIHDADTARLTGVGLDVASSTLAQLKELRLTGSDESIPMMEEVARLVGRRTPILVELKSGPKPAAVCPGVLQSLREYDVTFALMSFDPRMLSWVRRHSPSSTRVQLSGALRGEPLPLIAKVLVRSMVTNLATWPHAIAYDIGSAPSASLTFWRRLLRCPVLFWTVDSPAGLDRARHLNGNPIFETIRP
ncbi:MAG TPA: glycerophosphodiester phosphodiesterase family protein [Frankiaceae bacterium]|nr:glycerophosphodiester phosphodiesterase family protein [Frankiaceae bacterium]